MDDSRKGIITDIHRASTVDGPGLRTTVFLKGCPLRCLWCHNPETQAFFPEPAQDGETFTYGREVSVRDIMEIVLKDRDYYERSGGGATVSGGEPMAQPEFALALLRECRESGIHTILDTSGMMSDSSARRSLPVVNRYFFDYKATDSHEHRTLTGKGKERVLRTLEILNAGGAAITLRCPLIPGLNDSSSHLKAIAALANHTACIDRVDLLGWHTMGKKKYQKLGRVLSARLPEKEADTAIKEHYRLTVQENVRREIPIRCL